MPKDHLTFEESAKILGERGIDVKPSTVKRWHARGKIESLKIGRVVRIPLASLEKIIKQNTKFQT